MLKLYRPFALILAFWIQYRSNIAPSRIALQRHRVTVNLGLRGVEYAWRTLHAIHSRNRTIYPRLRFTLSTYLESAENVFCRSSQFRPKLIPPAAMVQTLLASLARLS
jgi:hypothetical protein